MRDHPIVFPAELMASPKPAKPSIYLTLCLTLLFISVVFSPFSVHNGQRFVLIFIAAVSLFFTIACHLKRPEPGLFNTRTRLAFGLVFGFGLLSVINAGKPQWALIELAVLLACCCVVCGIAGQRTANAKSDRLLISFVVALCCVKTLQFAAGATAAFVGGVDVLDMTILFEGFSNLRSYGQFQTFTLPLLALPLLYPQVKKSAKAWVFVLLACWWMIAISGGTRGTWMALAAAAVVLLFCGQFGRRWAGWQLTGAASGFALFWLLFSVLPAWLDIKIINSAGDRLTTTLSARDILWQQAWEMIKARPWLGYGPMGFADIPNPIAAHPHQAILQWASEWGVPSALLVCGLAAKGLYSTFTLIRAKAGSDEPVDVLRIGLFASLVAALAQSMVDGIIVMPYSQLWLCLIVGWLIAIHPRHERKTASSPTATWAWLTTALCAVLFLGYVVVRDVPHMEENEQRYMHDFGGHFQPRFWLQGVIAAKPQ